MPLVKIDLLEGRTLEQKRELVRKVTEVVSEVAKVNPDKVHIFITEHTRDQVAAGGKLFIDN